MQWHKILHFAFVKDQSSIQLGFASFNRNVNLSPYGEDLVPLHELPFAICYMVRIIQQRKIIILIIIISYHYLAYTYM